MEKAQPSNLRDKLLKPAADIRNLLRWGYPKFATIRFVADHAGLNTQERQILVRVILPPDKTHSRAKKSLDCTQLRGRVLLIDGYNVLLCIDSLLKGELMWLCDDGFIRDTRFYFGKRKQISEIEEALETLLSFLAGAAPKAVSFLLDSQISKSGELAGLIRKRLNEKGIDGGAWTSKHVDFDLKRAGKLSGISSEKCTKSSSLNNLNKYLKRASKKDPEELSANFSKYIYNEPLLIATSDGIIIDEVFEVLDIPGCLMEKKGLKAFKLH